MAHLEEGTFSFPDGTPERILQSPRVAELAKLALTLRAAMDQPPYAGERFPQAVAFRAANQAIRAAELPRNEVDQLSVIAASLPSSNV